MNASVLFKIDRLEQLVAEGLVNKGKHPDEDLWIYNYSKTCAYSGAWNNVTLACRGLILDEEYNVIARPFPKFFNIEERSRSDIIWKRPFQLFEKVDGSLGILYPVGDDFAIATRGSFASDQAIRATDIWNEKYADWEPPQGYTCLFEIIYPANRIVVDYGDTEDLIFLAAVHIETGANIFGDQIDWPGLNAQRFDPQDIHPRDLKEKLKINEDTSEGFVLYFPHANERVKVKYDNYLRLHRIVTGVSSKTIWEFLSQNKPLTEIIENVPDEFFDWVTKTAFSLQEDYDSIWDKVIDGYHNVLDRIAPGQPVLYQEDYCRAHRKEFAEIALKKEYSALLFRMLDRKSCVEEIWKLVKPEYERPFSQDIDK